MTNFRSSYLKVEVCLCEILVQRRRQVLDSSDYNTAVRGQGVGRVKGLTTASYSLAPVVCGPCASFLSTSSSHVRCDFKGEGCACVLSCVQLCDPMDHSPPGSSPYGISQARILEGATISFSRGSSQPRDRTHVSALAGGFFSPEPPGSPSERDTWHTPHKTPVEKGPARGFPTKLCWQLVLALIFSGHSFPIKGGEWGFMGLPGFFQFKEWF